MKSHACRAQRTRSNRGGSCSATQTSSGPSGTTPSVPSLPLGEGSTRRWTYATLCAAVEAPGLGAALTAVLRDACEALTECQQGSNARGPIMWPTRNPDHMVEEQTVW